MMCIRVRGMDRVSVVGVLKLFGVTLLLCEVSGYIRILFE